MDSSKKQKTNNCKSKEFSQRIKTYFRSKGKTVEEVSTELGICRETMSRKINAPGPIDFNLMIQLVATLDLGPRDGARLFRIAGYDLLADVPMYDDVWKILEMQGCSKAEKNKILGKYYLSI